MRIAFLAAIGVVLAGGGALHSVSAAGADDMTITGPAGHKNLSIFFVHGRSEAGQVPLTLAEAMEKGAVRVIETGSVNDLLIEPVGSESVFIQAGDIVKGGQQDRVLMSSLLLTPGAGKVSIGSYCVEAGLWAPRGKEDAKQFSSSADSVPSRVAKLVLNSMPMQADAAPQERPRVIRNADPSSSNVAQRTLRTQTEERFRGSGDTSARQKKIWDEVAGMQAKLKVNAGAATSDASKTSLQLSLENERVRQSRQMYVAAIEKAPAAPDIIGFVVAINGQISSAELYPSNALFMKLWPKQLAAAATEAVANQGSTGVQKGTGAGPLTNDVKAFLASARAGQTASRQIGSISDFTHIESASALFVEARTTGGQWYHRSYVAK